VERSFAVIVVSRARPSSGLPWTSSFGSRGGAGGGVHFFLGGHFNGLLLCLVLFGLGRGRRVWAAAVAAKAPAINATISLFMGFLWGWQYGD
jgi:hypothetical protein